VGGEVVVATGFAIRQCLLGLRKLAAKTYTLISPLIPSSIFRLVLWAMMPVMMYYIYTFRNVMDLSTGGHIHVPLSGKGVAEAGAWLAVKKDEDVKQELEALRKQFSTLQSFVIAQSSKMATAEPESNSAVDSVKDYRVQVISDRVDELADKIEADTTTQYLLTQQDQINALQVTIERNDLGMNERFGDIVTKLQEIDAKQGESDLSQFFSRDIQGQWKLKTEFISMLAESLPKSEQKLAEPSTPRLTEEAITSLIKSEVSKHTEQFSKLIDQKLDVFSADKLGIPDYALASSGGRIDPRHTSATYSLISPTFERLIGSMYKKGPKVILDPNTAPGNCWPMSGIFI
jgi:hypothetical protein